jgi:hypothetical protein
MLGCVFVLMVESIATSAIDKALEAVLRKVGEGKKLSTEDLGCVDARFVSGD